MLLECLATGAVGGLDHAQSVKDRGKDVNCQWTRMPGCWESFSPLLNESAVYLLPGSQCLRCWHSTPHPLAEEDIRVQQHLSSFLLSSESFWLRTWVSPKIFMPSFFYKEIHWISAGSFSFLSLSFPNFLLPASYCLPSVDLLSSLSPYFLSFIPSFLFIFSLLSLLLLSFFLLFLHFSCRNNADFVVVLNYDVFIDTSIYLIIYTELFITNFKLKYTG